MMAGSNSHGVHEEIIEIVRAKLDAFLAKAEDVCRGMSADEKRKVVVKVVDDLLAQVRARLRAGSDKPGKEITEAEREVTEFVYEYIEGKLDLVDGSRAGT